MADELRAGTIDTLPERPDIQSEPGPPVNGEIDWGPMFKAIEERRTQVNNPAAAAALAGGPNPSGVGPNPSGGQPTLQPQQGAPPAPNQDPFKPRPGILGNGVIEGTPQAGAPAASPAPMAAPPTQPGHMSAANYRQQMGLPPPGSDPAIPPNPVTAAPPLPGTSPQQLELLRQAMHVGGHMLGGPVGSMAARGLTKVLGM